MFPIESNRKMRFCEIEITFENNLKLYLTLL